MRVSAFSGSALGGGGDPERDQPKLVSGSATTTPGTYDFRNAIPDCGRTLKAEIDAGTTTAPPFASVTGSPPGTSRKPSPSVATKICADDFPGGRTNSCSAWMRKFSTTK